MAQKIRRFEYNYIHNKTKKRVKSEFYTLFTLGVVLVEKMENEPYHQSLYKSRVCAYAFTLETH